MRLTHITAFCIALCALLGLGRAASAQRSYGPIAQEVFDAHCDLLAFDEKQRDRAGDIFADYNAEWAALNDNDRALNLWFGGLSPRPWDGWSRSLNDEIDAFFHALAQALLIAGHAIDNQYFDALQRLSPAELEAIDLMRVSRAHTRCVQKASHEPTFPFTGLPFPLPTSSDPLTLLIAAEVPPHRGTDTWRHMVAWLNESRRLTVTLEQALDESSGGPRMRAASAASKAARRTQSFEESRELIDAVARLRAAPVGHAQTLRAIHLRHLELIATSLRASDSVRFRDVMCRRLYPVLFEPATDILRITAHVRRTETLSDAQAKQFDELDAAFRAERDAFCARFESVLRLATSAQQAFEIWLGVERIRWGEARPEHDTSEFDAMIAEWQSVASRRIEQIASIIGHGPEITVPMLEAALAENGAAPVPGCAILLRTGQERWGIADPEWYTYPGMTRASTLYLAEQGAKILGTDALGWDRPFHVMRKAFEQTGDTGQIWDGHFAGREREVFIIQQLDNLAALPPSGFMVGTYGIKLAHCSAAPARVVAFLDQTP